VIKAPEKSAPTLRQRVARSGANLPGPAIRLLTTLRNLSLWAVEPVDYAARLVNGKTQLPPLHVRRQAGPLAGLEYSGAEFVSYLKLLCNLKFESRILDVGCGFGLLALNLNNYLREPGHYLGIDIDRRAVKWATRHITSRSPLCEFRHLDIANPAYNPRGLLSADDVKFSLADASCDAIVLKSVFTHLRPEATRNYLGEIRRMLSPTGACLSTFFVFDLAREDSKNRASLDFAFGNNEWRFAVREMPELAIAYSDKFLRKLIAASGLAIKSTYPGAWSGADGGLSYQDVLVLTPQ
jgi:SAM-dependent methyltransferase